MKYTDAFIPSLVLLTTLSTSVLSVSYEAPYLLPKDESNYSTEIVMSNLKNNMFNDIPNLSIENDNYINNKINIIVEFSSKLISNSIDIDSEFVDIVNEHFWELI